MIQRCYDNTFILWLLGAVMALSLFYAAMVQPWEYRVIYRMDCASFATES